MGSQTNGRLHVAMRTASVVAVATVGLIMILLGQNTGVAVGYPPPGTTPTVSFPQYSFYLYLPIVMKAPIIEYDIPPCRWPHTIGSNTGFAYSWGSNLMTPGSLWRNAFEAALAAWTSAPTKTYYYENTQGTGPVFINTYYALDNTGGKAQYYCSVPNPTTTVAYDVLGNTAYYYSNGNGYQAYAGHESGHGQSLGHIAGTDIALLGYNPDIYTYYTPQIPDIELVNQVYP